MLPRKMQLFWPVGAALLLADCSSKELALDHLSPHVPREVVGDVVRLTLAFNPGAAFGLDLLPRWALIAVGIAALALLGSLYRATAPDHGRRAVALALITGGAVGNLLDRIRSPLGVVDFIDVGVGTLRWWTFNLADVGIVVGAALLLPSLWREAESPAAPATPEAAGDSQALR